MIHARYYGLKPKTARSTALELLEFMELIDKRDREISELSGGMKRRLMIARGLLNAPEILVLDEPTTGLDPQARHLVWERLRSLKRRGVTLLLTTHYMEEAAQLCDRLVIMDQGRILVEGSPREVVAGHTSPEVVEVFEPPPDAQAQLDSIGDMAQRVDKLADRWLFYRHCQVIGGLGDSGLSFACCASVLMERPVPVRHCQVGELAGRCQDRWS